MSSRALLADRVNREILIAPDALFDLFARVQHNVTEAVRVLTKASPKIAVMLIEVGSEVVAKLQRNKSLYRRRVGYLSEDEEECTLRDAAIDPDADTEAFICDCFDLARDLTAKRDVAHHVENTRLSRMLVERFLRDFVKAASDYRNAVWRLASSTEITVNYVREASHVEHMRHDLMIDPAVGYGVIRFVESRLAAVDAIYGKIATAYARVILKVAKVNAIDDDHFLELFQYGYFGLHRANATYDYVLNAKFVAVAKWWVRQSIMYHMKASSGTIKISPSIWQHRARMESMRQKLLVKTGDGSNAAVAAALGTTERNVDTVYDSVRLAQVGAFDAAVHDTQTVDADADTQWHDVQDAIRRLSAQERAYLAVLHSVDTNVPQTLDPEQVRYQKMRQRMGALLISLA